MKGLLEALDDPDSGVSCNYSVKYVEKTFMNLQKFKGGHALFNLPPMPIKCPGAPQKIMYLVDDYLRAVSGPGVYACMYVCVCVCVCVYVLYVCM